MIYLAIAVLLTVLLLGMIMYYAFEEWEHYEDENDTITLSLEEIDKLVEENKLRIEKENAGTA